MRFYLTNWSELSSLTLFLLEGPPGAPTRLRHITSKASQRNPTPGEIRS